MASLLRSFMPVPTSKIDDFDDEYSVEYSFAIEDKGPPVSYDIPQVVPVDVQRIPIAAVVSTASSLSNLSLPVIQPIVKSMKKSDRESKVSGTEGVRSFAPEEVLERDTPVVSDQEGVLDGSEHSSGTLGFSDSPNNESHEISGSSDIEDVKVRARMGIIGDDDEDSIRDALEDYALEVSSQISIWEEMEEGEDDADEEFNQGNRTAVVTFCEPESSNGTSEFSYGDEPESIDVKPVARTDLKKGSCHRCLKGSRFMEKEVCIVCGAKYCCNCLLRAMGSMPEGRKCLTCIGFSIRESKRGSLGKSSKALKKLLVEGQVKEIMRNEVTCEANQIPAKLVIINGRPLSLQELVQLQSCRNPPSKIMRNEVTCEANQIPAKLVIINGRPLSLQELVQLQSCRNPPSKIRPGRYWYDKVSGYWGREGHQPCQIISPSMEIGGGMELKASNGNTNVVINGREITKKELIILKTAGIHCEGNPQFWLSEDGSCRYEGQKNVMGMLWQRSTTKLACTALCLPLPPRICDEEGALDPVNHIDENIVQIPAKLVIINGRPLSLQELVQLQSCRNPPSKIRPGRYWYDRVSGYWGREGHQPCQIISPSMEIGGGMELKASNGNTNVVINGREITKKELIILKTAGIHCEGNPQFWLSEDGSCRYEGQKNVMGMLWQRSTTKLACTALCLPLPPRICDEEGALDPVNHIDENIVHKLLLVGCDQSGTSTIFKQAKILYKVPFSEDELESVKLLIQTNLYRYIGILLEARDRFEEECLDELKRQHLSQPGPSAYAEKLEEKNTYSMSPRLKAFSDWLLKVMMSGNLEAVFPAATREYARNIEELVKDAGFQAAYSRRNELDMLPRVANYFLDRAVEISRADYEPSNMDILYAEGITPSNGVASMEFSFPVSNVDTFNEPVEQSVYSSSNKYQLIRVDSSSLGRKCKWLGMFEDVDMVIFCVSLTDYDEYYVDSEGVYMNKMVAHRKFMENIVLHPSFAHKDFLLLLNKLDILDEKLERVPLSECEWFHDFNPVVNNGSSNPSLAQRAYHYIAVRFKRMFDDLTDQKLYVSPVTGLESKSVDEALKYSREILRWEEDKPRVCRNEFSSESIEASSSS